MTIRIIAATFAFALCATAAAACGKDSDCFIGERTYRIYMPESAAPGSGAIIFAHGYRGAPSGTMRNKAFLALADELGVALVAPKAYADDWRIPGVPADPGADGQVELDFFDALVIDLGRRFGIDTGHLLMTGFSAGGMMTWQLACDRPDLFAGFAPISGTFWAPVPDHCSGKAVDLIHTHGTSDKIVPIGGREIGPTRQGDVMTALAMLTADGGYGAPESFAEDGLDCTDRVSPDGRLLEFCTHPRGHDFRVAYVRRAWLKLLDRGSL